MVAAGAIASHCRMRSHRPLLSALSAAGSLLCQEARSVQRTATRFDLRSQVEHTQLIVIHRQTRSPLALLADASRSEFPSMCSCAATDELPHADSTAAALFCSYEDTTCLAALHLAMSLPTGVSFPPSLLTLESHTHAYLFARLQHYLGVGDHITTSWLAERLITSLKEAARAAQAVIDAGTASPAEIEQSRQSLPTLSASLESVCHLAALALYREHASGRTRLGATNSQGTTNLPGAPAPVETVSGGAYYAYKLLRDQHRVTAENQYLFAQCCFELGKYTEAEQALLTYSTPITHLPQLPQSTVPHVLPPLGASGLRLLGHCASRSGRTSEAREWFRKALQVDPLCWSAWVALCAAGGAENETAVEVGVMNVDLREFEQTCEEVNLAAASANAAGPSHEHSDDFHPTSPTRPRRAPLDTTQANPLLHTPGSSLALPMRGMTLNFTNTTTTLGKTPAMRTDLLTTGVTPAGPPVRGGLFATPFIPTSAMQPHQLQRKLPGTAGGFQTPPTSSPSNHLSTPPPRVAGSSNRAAGVISPTPSGVRVARGKHVRAASTSTPFSVSQAAAAGAPGSVPASRRKIAGKLNYGESASKATPAAASSTSAGEMSDDSSASAFSSLTRKLSRTRPPPSSSAGGQERERKTPRKEGENTGPTTPRRGPMPTPGGEGPMSPRRGAAAEGPMSPRSRSAAAAAGEAGSTTPRRGGRDGASAAAPGTARKAPSSSSGATPSTSSTRRALLSGGSTPATTSHAAAAAANAPRKRLPEISEAATPDEATGSANPSALNTPMTSGTNLLGSLGGVQLTGARAGAARAGHARTRSQPASSFETPLSGVDAGAMEEDEEMRDYGDADENAGTDGDAQGHTEEEDDVKMDDAGGGGGGEDDPERSEDDFGGAEGENAAAAAAHLREQVSSARDYLTSLLQTICEAYRLQSLYQCRASISTYSLLPCHQFSTPSILSGVGRCYFDLQSYPQACDMFEQAMVAGGLGVGGGGGSGSGSDGGSLSSLEPSLPSSLFTSSSLSGPPSISFAGLYSSALWHLGRSAELSGLAMRCVGFDAGQAEAWIVVGNVFSLVKEHEIALKFFRRALQLSPYHPYAATLSAHEYMAVDDFDRAQVGYRLALGMDERCYNAWYGLGNLYLRQEKYASAVYHFQRAIHIHPSSSVLHCYLGMTLHAARKYPEALSAFHRADELEANNPLAKYHLAHVHLALGEDEQALVQLKILRALAPRESNIPFLLGRISKRRGASAPPGEAMRYFMEALELETKDRAMIKAAIEALHEGKEEDEEGEEFA
jgi:tetratricopeptide (TPR) repeat protein